MSQNVVLIAHNVRSTHNVGSLLRTAEGLGVSMVFLTGYTPYPKTAHDSRLPHIYTKLDSQIHKTALGAEATQAWQYQPDLDAPIAELKRRGFVVAALEQAKAAQPLPNFKPPQKLAILVGNEVDGLAPADLDQTDLQLYIPMAGQKESFNVAQAAAMALYQACLLKH